MKFSFRKVLKYTAGLTVGLYALAYLGLTARVHYDYYTRDQTAFAEHQQTLLEVRRFKADVDGREKYLTIAGEAHYYNQREHEIGQKLVKEHTHVAYESFRGNTSLVNRIYTPILWAAKFPSLYFFQLGTGRTYDSILVIAYKKGYKVIDLEENRDQALDLTFPPSQRLVLLTKALGSSLVGPLSYYNAGVHELMVKFTAESSSMESFLSFEEWLNKDGYYYPDREKAIESHFLLAERDKKIAQGVNLNIRRDKIDKLLVGVGLVHLDGVIWYLSKELELKEIKEK